MVPCLTVKRTVLILKAIPRNNLPEWRVFDREYRERNWNYHEVELDHSRFVKQIHLLTFGMLWFLTSWIPVMSLWETVVRYLNVCSTMKLSMKSVRSLVGQSYWIIVFDNKRFGSFVLFPMKNHHHQQINLNDFYWSKGIKSNLHTWIGPIRIEIGVIILRKCISTRWI